MLAIWAAITAAGFFLIGRFGLSFPYADEWSMFPVVIGQQPVTPQWLWAQHNEHRLPLPRLLYTGLGRLTGYNFLAPQMFDMALLSLTALALILAVRRYRGRTVLPDALFPLILMQWGQVDNLIWGFQLGFIVPASLATLTFAVTLFASPGLSLRQAIPVFLLLLGAGLCGANGVVFLPPMACWFVWAALVDRRGTGWPRFFRMAGLLLMAAILVGYTLFYFRGFVRPAHHGVPPGLWAVARTTLEVLAVSLSPGVKEIWPVSGVPVPLACLLTIGVLWRAFRRDPLQRVRAVGFLASMSAIVLLAAGIGFGRSFFGPGAGMAIRYVTLTAPIWCLFYLVATVYLSGKTQQHIQRLLCGIVLVACAAGMHKGWRVGAETIAPFASLEADAQAGIEPDALAARYADRMAFDGQPVLANRLRLLREHRLGPYRGDPLPAPLPIRVDRLAPISHPPIAPMRHELNAGRSIKQTFTLVGPGRLERIDVETCRSGRRSPEQLVWILWRVEPAGGATEVARGRYALAQTEYDEYMSLRFAPVELGASATFVLELLNDAMRPGRRVLLPLYAPLDGFGPARTLAGFAFIRQ